MTNLPTKREPSKAPEVGNTPTWRELAERFRDIVKDVLREGKEMERDLEPRLLPALKRMKAQLESLIAKLEERAKPQ